MCTLIVSTVVSAEIVRSLDVGVKAFVS